MKNVENKIEQAAVRVFGYKQARELTAAELEMVGGGLSSTTYCDTGDACAADDCGF